MLIFSCHYLWLSFLAYTLTDQHTPVPLPVVRHTPEHVQTYMWTDTYMSTHLKHVV